MVQSLIPIWEEYKRTGMRGTTLLSDLDKPLPEDVSKDLSLGLGFDYKLMELCFKVEEHLPHNDLGFEHPILPSANLPGSLSQHCKPREKEMTAALSEDKDVCPVLLSVGEIQSSETVLPSDPKATDTEVSGLLRWLATSHAAEDINSDDELVRESILTPLLPATTMDKVLEKANIDYKSESQKECQDILDLVEDLIIFEEKGKDNLDGVNFNVTEACTDEIKEYLGTSFSSENNFGKTYNPLYVNLHANDCNKQEASTLVECSARDLMRKKRSRQIEPADCGSVRSKNVYPTRKKEAPIFISPKQLDFHEVHDDLDMKAPGSLKRRPSFTNKQEELAHSNSTYGVLPQFSDVYNASEASTDHPEHKGKMSAVKLYPEKCDSTISVGPCETYNDKKFDFQATAAEPQTGISGSWCLFASCKYEVQGIDGYILKDYNTSGTSLSAHKLVLVDAVIDKSDLLNEDCGGGQHGHHTGLNRVYDILGNMLSSVHLFERIISKARRAMDEIIPFFHRKQKRRKIRTIPLEITALTPVFSPPSVDSVYGWLSCLDKGTSKQSNELKAESPPLTGSSECLISSKKSSPVNHKESLTETTSKYHMESVLDRGHPEKNLVLDFRSRWKIHAYCAKPNWIPSSCKCRCWAAAYIVKLGESRGDLRPDPQFDAVNVIALAIQNDYDYVTEVYVLLYSNGGFCQRSRDGISGFKVFDFDEEKHLFGQFMDILCSLDPDILMGWDIQGCSLGFLDEIEAHLGIGLLNKISRTPSETKIKAEETNTSEKGLEDELLLQPLVADNVVTEDAIIEDEWGRTHASGVHVGAIPYKVLTIWYSSGRARASESMEISQISFPGFTVHPGLQLGSQFRVESMFVRLAHSQNYLVISPGSQQRGRQPIPNDLIKLVEDLNAWNLFPWGSYLWKVTWNKLSSALDDRKSLHGDSSKYTLTGFIWAFKIWIFEAFPAMKTYAIKTSNDIPRAISWKRKRTLQWEDLLRYTTINNPPLREPSPRPELSPHPEPSSDRPGYTPPQRQPSPILSHHRASSPPSPQDRRPAKMPRRLSPCSPPPPQRDELGELRDEVNALREEVGTLRKDDGAWRVEVSTLRGEVAALREMVASLQNEVHTLRNERPDKVDALRRVFLARRSSRIRRRGRAITSPFTPMVRRLRKKTRLTGHPSRVPSNRSRGPYSPSPPPVPDMMDESGSRMSYRLVPFQSEER
ncbi:hypothetical protein F3Y22_tig00002317pilonHSYRG00172 [Hibiscus syriacus]|uniref:DNA-directed DNA polymerase family B exonuclease domain-containing protein n=1 Tax=Hibiscus syriacus TaxID=106335 RepID=A0A6A3CTV6_HIBSY|nr:hypothetical protein F3Y22_tig00002317pilonHSYRG00172 [Hibiscus syriacus]